MNGQQIEKEIYKAEKGLSEIQFQISEEKKRLQAFGSKQSYHDALAKEKEIANTVALLKSRRRTQIMQEIGDKEVLPKILSLRNDRLDESQRINLVLELALYLSAIQKLKTNFLIHERTGEVLFETSDPQLKNIYAEKEQKITTYLERVPQQQDVAEIRDERWIEKSAGPITISLPFGKAISLQRENRGKIISSEEPVFTEVVREDREPEIMASVRKINLGQPIEIDGQISDRAKELQRRSLSAKVEISPANFRFYIQDRDVQKVLKKYRVE
jgi:hypothetical protein